MFIRQNIFCATFGRRKLTNRQVQEGVFEQMLYFELSMIKLFYSGILAIHILVEIFIRMLLPSLSCSHWACPQQMRTGQYPRNHPWGMYIPSPAIRRSTGLTCFDPRPDVHWGCFPNAGSQLRDYLSLHPKLRWARPSSCGQGVQRQCKKEVYKYPRVWRQVKNIQEIECPVTSSLFVTVTVLYKRSWCSILGWLLQRVRMIFGFLDVEIHGRSTDS